MNVEAKLKDVVINEERGKERKRKNVNIKDGNERMMSERKKKNGQSEIKGKKHTQDENKERKRYEQRRGIIEGGV